MQSNLGILDFEGITVDNRGLPDDPLSMGGKRKERGRKKEKETQAKSQWHAKKEDA